MKMKDDQKTHVVVSNSVKVAFIKDINNAVIHSSAQLDATSQSIMVCCL